MNQNKVLYPYSIFSLIFIMKKSLLFLFLLFLLPELDAGPVSRYNVVWNSPSKNASGTMPVGNGDVGANVYALENGSLYLLLSKNDAYTYCGDIFKTGRIKITFSPNPFTPDRGFVQELDLETASVNISSDDLKIRIWVDANNPVCHVSAKSKTEYKVSVESDLWERFDHCEYNTFVNKGEKAHPMEDTPITQDSIVPCDDGMMWFYNVGDRSVYQRNLDFYDVGWLSSRYPDPYKYNVFGNYVKSDGLEFTGNGFRGKTRHFDVSVYSLTMKTKDTDEWIKTIKDLSDRPLKYRKDWGEHCKWWKDFWNRSWIRATDRNIPEEEREHFLGEATNGRRMENDVAGLISQSYQFFRYFMATQGRGPVPVKFNGGIFTQQLVLAKNDNVKRSGKPDIIDGVVLSHPDDRMWGRRFTFQNQRLLYWPLLMSGDSELMLPFMSYYVGLLPHRKAVTKAWFGHEGAYLHEIIEPTGMEKDCGNTGKPLKAERGSSASHYHDFYFTSTLELLAMMIQYSEYSGDKKFIDEGLLPYAREALRFFRLHYPCDSEGKLILDPSMVLETFWKAKNPSSDISGLFYCLNNLLRLGYGDEKDRTEWVEFLSMIPPLPMSGSGDNAYILPAESYSNKNNAENGEIYPIFPFCHFGKPFGNENIALNTMKKRTVVDAFGCMCWGQDQVGWAYACDTLEVKKGLERRFRVASTQCRFPMFGREIPDSCPDFDHFGVGSVAFQRMLVQESPEKIVLFPAWPLSWNVDFKLHVTGGIIQGVLKDGKLKELKTFPSGLKDKIEVNYGL